MFLSHKALNSRHMMTAFCRQGAERKRRHLAKEEARVGAETVFTSYGVPLAQVNSFKYIGWIIMAVDDDWPELVRDLQKARCKWAWLTRVMGREGVDAQTLGQI